MALKIDCPKCGERMVVHYDHWVDPLLECRNDGCVMSQHKHRASEIVEDDTDDS